MQSGAKSHKIWADDELGGGENVEEFYEVFTKNLRRLGSLDQRRIIFQILFCEPGKESALLFV